MLRSWTRGLLWLEKAPDTRVVWLVLMGIPRWVPLVSCFVALVLLFPCLFNMVGTQTILPLLVSADPKTYTRLRREADAARAVVGLHLNAGNLLFDVVYCT